MKNIIFTSIVVLLLAAMTKGGPALKQGQGENPGAELYRQLHYCRLASDVAVSAALLNHLEQGETKVVESILTSRLKADLLTISLATNRTWTGEQSQAIQMAQDYLKSRRNQ